MLIFSKIIPDPMFEKWLLNNAKEKIWDPNFFINIGNLINNKGLNSF